jgi:hypothetical protein
MISARTKAALAAAKRRGVKLGGDRGARLTAKARAAGRAAVQERARKAGRWITFHYRAPRSVITAWAASVGGLILQWHQPKKRPRRHSRTKAIFARFGIRTFRPTLRKAEEKLKGLRTAEGSPLLENTRTELCRELSRSRPLPPGPPEWWPRQSRSPGGEPVPRPGLEVDRNVLPPSGIR